MAVRAAIGLGSNLGDRAGHIAGALAELATLGDIVAVSSRYETAPVGGPRQDPYLNAVVLLDTDLSPEALLDGCLRIEAGRGRERRERWGPRTLDLDILLFGDVAVDEPGLEIPHPRMVERRFVLEPLLEVWPAAALPDGTPLAPRLDGLQDQQVRRVEVVIPDRRSAAILFWSVALAAVVIWLLVGRLLGE